MMAHIAAGDDDSYFADDTLSTDPSDLERIVGAYSVTSNSETLDRSSIMLLSHASASLATIPIVDEGIEPMYSSECVEEHYLRRQLEAELDFSRTIVRETTADTTTIADTNDNPSIGCEGGDSGAELQQKTNGDAGLFYSKHNALLLVVLVVIVAVVAVYEIAAASDAETATIAATRESEITELIRKVVGKPVVPNKSMSASALDQALSWVIHDDFMLLSPGTIEQD